MNQKGLANMMLVAVVVIFAALAGYFALLEKSEPAQQQPTPTFSLTSTTTFPPPPAKIQPQPSTSIPGEDQPQIKYQIFQPGLGNKEILNSTYLVKNDILPKEIRFNGIRFFIKKVEIEKLPERGFGAYVTVSYNNQEHKIGFWHPDDPTKSYFLKTNGCSKGKKTYDNVCAAF